MSEIDDTVGTLILNGLEALASGNDGVLADDASKEGLASAYEAATTADERDAFREALRDLRVAADEAERIDDETARTIEDVVERVRSELAARDATIVVNHETALELSARDVALYEFALTRDPDGLSDVVVSPEAAGVHEGAEALTAGEYDRALEAFSRAIAAEPPRNDELVARVAAALVAHWRGDDDRALEHVQAALLLDPESWTARMAGVAAGHESPDRFRADEFGCRLYFRGRFDVPDGCDVDVRTGRVRRDGSVEWTAAPGDLECMPLSDLPRELRVRIELRGDATAVPSIHVYYLALGVVDYRDDPPSARTVDQTLLDGPIAEATAAQPIETIEIEFGDGDAR